MISSSSEPQFISMPFYEWLTLHSELVPFIQIDSIPGNITQDRRDAIAANFAEDKKQYIKQICNFMKNKLLCPELPKFLPRPSADSALRAMSVFHIISFLQSASYKIRKKAYESSCAKCRDLLDLLQAPGIFPRNIMIKVLCHDLFQSLATLPPKLMAINLKEAQILSEYDKMMSAPAPMAILQKVFSSSLASAVQEVDTSTFYFQPHISQIKFEQIIFSNTFPLKSAIAAFLFSFPSKARSDFTECLMSICNSILQLFEVSLPTESSVAIISIFRSLFDEAYSINPTFFYTDDHKPIKIDPERSRCKNFLISNSSLPEHEDSEQISEVMMKDHWYRMASLHICNASLVNNPFDALYELNCSLQYIRKGISSEAKRRNEHEDSPSFETVFGLFIGAIMMGSAEEFQLTANFIDVFAPKSGLCSEFEFVVATVSAAQKYFSLE